MIRNEVLKLVADRFKEYNNCSFSSDQHVIEILCDWWFVPNSDTLRKKAVEALRLALEEFDEATPPTEWLQEACAFALSDHYLQYKFLVPPRDQFVEVSEQAA